MEIVESWIVVDIVVDTVDVWIVSMKVLLDNTVTNAGLLHLMSHRSYRALYLCSDNNRNITLNDMIALLPSRSFFEDLNLDGCPVASDNVLVVIAGCSLLRNLNIRIKNGSSGAGLVDIVRSCSILKYLDIYPDGGFVD